MLQDPREALIVSLKREVKILQQENNHLRKLLELAEFDPATTAAIAGGGHGSIPNQITNGDGGRGNCYVRYIHKILHLLFRKSNNHQV